MRLIGMLDSPYVRRTALALHALGLSFDHDPVSVFVDFDRFRQLNPVVKAPTLICDDGTVLLDSSLIIDYAQSLAPDEPLLPSQPAERARALRRVGLGLASCDKAVQWIYERSLRPADKQFEPWLQRVRGQILGAVGELEAEVRAQPSSLASLAGITSGVTWFFLQAMLPELVPAADYPALQALSASAEQTPGFRQYPYGGPGVPPL